MSRCKKCGKRMQYNRDFCCENCADEYFEEQEIEEKSEDEEVESENS